MGARLLVLIAATAFAAACGGKTEEGSDAGGDGQTSDAKPLDPNCPTSEPKAGASCSKAGIACEYGSDPRYTCNELAECSNGAWEILVTDTAFCPTPAVNPPECPATFTSGDACNATYIPCHYAQGWCACLDLGGPPMPDAGPTTPTWQCSPGPSAGCPATRPHIGTSCAQPDTWCDYGVCGHPDGLSVQCDGSTLMWTASFGAPCGGG